MSKTNFEEAASKIEAMDTPRLPVNELNIMDPEGIKFSLGGGKTGEEERHYKIYPPVLRDMRKVEELTLILHNKSELDGDDLYDKLKDIFSVLLKEPDFDYLEKTIGQKKMLDLLVTVQKAQTIAFEDMGINPKDKKKT